MSGKNAGWTYTYVKIVDLVWDVVMGRGGQLLLIYIAYQVFSQSLACMMETRTVSYRTYHAVSFDSTSLRSVWQYIRSTSWNCSDQTWRSWGVFMAMMLASLYVVSMPTLFSAMTGYAAQFAPSVEVPPEEYRQGEYNCDGGACTPFPYGGGGIGGPSGEGLVPGWGVVIDSMRVNYASPWPISIGEAYGSMGKGDAYYLAQYYNRYEAAYDTLRTDPACHNVVNLTDCPATNIASAYTEPGYVVNLESPLLNIQLWGNDTATNVPNVWLCGDLILNTDSFNAGNINGICNAAPNVFSGTSYQWGFSFLLLLLVCILNLLFAMTVYGLWIDARRHSRTPIKHEKKVFPSGHVQWRAVDYPSQMKSVIAMAAQAREDHGDEVFTWSTRKLDKEIWKGKAVVRGRKAVSAGGEARD